MVPRQQHSSRAVNKHTRAQQPATYHPPTHPPTHSITHTQTRTCRKKSLVLSRRLSPAWSLPCSSEGPPLSVCLFALPGRRGRIAHRMASIETCGQRDPCLCDPLGGRVSSRPHGKRHWTGIGEELRREGGERGDLGPWSTHRPRRPRSSCRLGWRISASSPEVDQYLRWRFVQVSVYGAINIPIILR